LPPDQVVRLQAFRDKHPDITITPPAEIGSLWAARRDGLVICAEYDLRTLLDRLTFLAES
jgi:hypothetical protein